MCTMLTEMFWESHTQLPIKLFSTRVLHAPYCLPQLSSYPLSLSSEFASEFLCGRALSTGIFPLCAFLQLRRIAYSILLFSLLQISQSPSLFPFSPSHLPLFSRFLELTTPVQRNFFVYSLATLGCSIIGFAVGLPITMALYDEVGHLKISDLEENLQRKYKEERKEEGEEEEQLVYYNRGR